MGLADEKLKLSYKTTVEKFEKNLTEKGFPVKFAPKWETFTAINQQMVSTAESVSSQLAGLLNNYSINLNLEDYKMAWNAAIAAFNIFELVHNNELQKYDYKLVVQDKKLVFTANFNDFVFSSTSRDQKSLKETLEGIL